MPTGDRLDVLQSLTAFIALLHADDDDHDRLRLYHVDSSLVNQTSIATSSFTPISSSRLGYITPDLLRLQSFH